MIHFRGSLLPQAGLKGSCGLLRTESGWSSAKQTFYLLYYLSSPTDTILKTSFLEQNLCAVSSGQASHMAVCLAGLKTQDISLATSPLLSRELRANLLPGWHVDMSKGPQGQSKVSPIMCFLVLAQVCTTQTQFVVGRLEG